MVLRSRTHNPALMSLAFASGLRARIRLDGDTVVVTVGVDGLKPLTMVPAADGAVGAPTSRAAACPPVDPVTADTSNGRWGRAAPGCLDWASASAPRRAS